MGKQQLPGCRILPGVGKYECLVFNTNLKPYLGDIPHRVFMGTGLEKGTGYKSGNAVAVREK
jgi:hypothetical protein